MPKLNILILASGNNTRSGNVRPKILEKVRRRELLFHVIDTAMLLNPSKIIITVGSNHEYIMNTVNIYYPNNNFCFIYQDLPLGTTHALLCCYDFINNECKKTENFIILSAILMNLEIETIQSLISKPDSMLITSVDSSLNTDHEINSDLLVNFDQSLYTNNVYNKIIDCQAYNLTLKTIDKLIDNFNEYSGIIFNICDTINITIIFITLTWI